MLKELSNLKQYDRGVKIAEDDLAATTWQYNEQIKMITRVLEVVREKREADITVQQAVGNLEAMRATYATAETLAKQAVVAYWEEFGFSTGKKSVIMEGCKLSIRETTNRQVVDPGVVVQAAINDGVGDKVVRELKPVFNKAAFNAWVDLKAPSGVEVTHGITATVKILEEE